MSNKTSSSGLNTGGLLLVAFIVLKLTKVIDWSWWWILSPLWIGVALGIVALIIWLIVIYIKHKKQKKQRESVTVDDLRQKSGFQRRLEEAQRIHQERAKNRNL